MNDKMKIEYVDIDRIKPYGNNPRFNEESVDKVAESISNYGFQQPIVVDGDMVVIAGHTRLLASQKLGLKSIPCVIADKLTPEQVMAYRLDDNKSAEYSSWDFAKLSDELMALDEAGFDLSTLSFGEDEIESILSMTEDEAEDIDEEGETDEDSVPETDLNDIKSRRGETYALGDDGVLCCVPPSQYKVMDKGSCTASVVEYDKSEEDDIGSAMKSHDEIVGDSKTMFLFSDESSLVESIGIMADAGMTGMELLQTIAYTKPLVKRSGMLDSEVGFCYLFTSSGFRIDNRDGLTNFMEGISGSGERSVELFRNLVRASTRKGDSVFIPYASDGASVIACAKSGRKFIALEKSPSKCDVIRKRWAEFRNGKDCDWESATI